MSVSKLAWMVLIDGAMSYFAILGICTQFVLPFNQWIVLAACYIIDIITAIILYYKTRGC